MRTLVLLPALCWLAISGVSIALVALILALSFGREVEKVLQEELTTRGRMAALSVANTSATLVFAQDTFGLQTLAEATLADVPGAAYVLVRDESGAVLAETVKESLGSARPVAVSVEELNENLDPKRAMKKVEPPERH